MGPVTYAAETPHCNWTLHPVAEQPRAAPSTIEMLGTDSTDANPAARV